MSGPMTGRTHLLMGQIKDGILLIDKEAGETSFGVVKKVKRALGASREWKVGHAGTLDPFATGLLIILLGALLMKTDLSYDIELAGLMIGDPLETLWYKII